MFQKKRADEHSQAVPSAYGTMGPQTIPDPADDNACDRETLILKYTPFIKYIAGRIAVRLPPHLDINDVVHAGILGLIDAIDKFDASKGVLFKTYAEFRIRGAILDSLREMDWVPRSVRKNVSILERTYSELEKKNNRPATDEEVAAALNIEIEKLQEMIAQASGITLLSLEMLTPHEDARLKLLDCLIDTNASTPLTFLKNLEIRDIVADAIAALPEKERMVVSLYYYDDLTMKEISHIMHLTESRISQLHTKAILRLRGKLQDIIGEHTAAA
ncbi:MAG: FliA/WhiG family RNA polymerase sigma factor [Desulfobacterota bacterium]|nr:FliA/WhiG family RNA polymerase sigma factor [Thermodesulfobacteriota bacterium]